MVVSAAAGTAILTGALPAATKEKTMKKTFTTLHSNDMHSSFIGIGPAADYTPFTLNDDATRGGYARLASPRTRWLVDFLTLRHLNFFTQ
jgi:5'-nucleotidase/UDP-sugar diphosphatase